VQNITSIFISNSIDLNVEMRTGDLLKEGMWCSLHLFNDDLLAVSEEGYYTTLTNLDNGACICFSRDSVSVFNSSQYNLFEIFEKKEQYTKFVATNDIRVLFEQIFEHATSGLPEKYVMMVSFLAQLLVKLNGAYFSKQGQENNSKIIKDNNKINDIVNFIMLNLHRKITLNELEKEFFINKFYLCHLFKNTTGYTVADYISQKKVSLAKEMLRQNHSPSNVCTQLGFDDYSNFYRLFKKATGVSPSEYQKTRG